MASCGAAKAATASMLARGGSARRASREGGGSGLARLRLAPPETLAGRALGALGGSGGGGGLKHAEAPRGTGAFL